nr:MAG TPA: hypothetical protein [Caudoviricetes sp.]
MYMYLPYYIYIFIYYYYNIYNIYIKARNREGLGCNKKCNKKYFTKK